jgi:hypothetical protein
VHDATQVPLLQVCPLEHVPQLIIPPQPSEAVPQFCPAGQVVAGVQQALLKQTDEPVTQHVVVEELV